MQALLGKTGPSSLKRRIQSHDQKNVGDETLAKVEKLLATVDFAEVQNLSEGAAIFYSWVSLLYPLKGNHCAIGSTTITDTFNFLRESVLVVKPMAQ